MKTDQNKKVARSEAEARGIADVLRLFDLGDRPDPLGRSFAGSIRRASGGGRPQRGPPATS